MVVPLALDYYSPVHSFDSLMKEIAARESRKELFICLARKACGYKQLEFYCLSNVVICILASL